MTFKDRVWYQRPWSKIYVKFAVKNNGIAIYKTKLLI